MQNTSAYIKAMYNILLGWSYTFTVTDTLGVDLKVAAYRRQFSCSELDDRIKNSYKPLPWLNDTRFNPLAHSYFRHVRLVVICTVPIK